MGGFNVCPDQADRARVTLDPDDIEPYLINKDLDISEEDILDKSKGDVLSKSLVVLQVTWFMMQVLARVIQHLAITGLEVATVSFAILNVMTYFCWWRKPLDVKCPIFIATYYNPARRTSNFTSPIVTDTEYSSPASLLERIPSSPTDNSGSEEVVPASSSSIPVVTPVSFFPASARIADEEQGGAASRSSIPVSSSLGSSMSEQVDTTLPYTVPCLSHIPFPMKTILRSSHGSSWATLQCEISITPPVGNAPAVTTKLGWRRMPSLATTIFNESVKLVQQASVALWTRLKHPSDMFFDISGALINEFKLLAMRPSSEHYPIPVHTYAFGTLNHTENIIADSLATGIAVIFGVIHCLAWNFEFPTRTEKNLWRTSSAIMAVALPTRDVALHISSVSAPA
ncbi:hypothetical protein H0H92_001998 [Tricholoma furcatifolium]|nr:hypothetical protein H0H92_001998 [Tricholoma furcatifolium]